MRKIKIICDGTRQGTEVVDAETGEPIANVSHVSIELDSNTKQFCTATITVLLPMLDVRLPMRELQEKP